VLVVRLEHLMGQMEQTVLTPCLAQSLLRVAVVVAGQVMLLLHQAVLVVVEDEIIQAQVVLATLQVFPHLKETMVVMVLIMEPKLLVEAVEVHQQSVAMGQAQQVRVQVVMELHQPFLVLL